LTPLHRRSGSGSITDQKTANLIRLRQEGWVVATMAGGGDTDALALATADVGVAMGTAPVPGNRVTSARIYS